MKIQCIIKQLLNSIFVIFRIIKVEVSVITILHHSGYDNVNNDIQSDNDASTYTTDNDVSITHTDSDVSTFISNLITDSPRILHTANSRTSNFLLLLGALYVKFRSLSLNTGLKASEELVLFS
jgi:hypothetical protein